MLDFSACGAKPVSLGPLARLTMPEPQRHQLIAAELRRLVAASPTDKNQLAKWEVESSEIDARLRSTYPDIVFPIQVMHYLNDGDIRAKDASWREMQNRSMAGIIEECEQGQMPISRGTTVSVRPGSVVVFAVFAVCVVLFSLRSC